MADSKNSKLFTTNRFHKQIFEFKNNVANVATRIY